MASWSESSANTFYPSYLWPVKHRPHRPLKFNLQNWAYLVPLPPQWPSRPALLGLHFFPCPHLMLRSRVASGAQAIYLGIFNCTHFLTFLPYLVHHQILVILWSQCLVTLPLLCISTGTVQFRPWSPLPGKFFSLLIVTSLPVLDVLIYRFSREQNDPSKIQMGPHHSFV